MLLLLLLFFTVFDVVAVVLLAVYEHVYSRIRYWIIVSLLNMIVSIYIISKNSVFLVVVHIE